MPRGFLVKRKRKAISYRVPNEDRVDRFSVQPGFTEVFSADLVPQQRDLTSPPPATPRVHTPNMEETERPAQFGTPDSGYSSYSPVRPVNMEQEKQFFDRSFSTTPSVAPETYVAHPTLVVPLGRIYAHSLLRSEPSPSVKRPCPSPSGPSQEGIRDKTPAKKCKPGKKLSFQEEMLTSPVLGLRIKEESDDSASAKVTPAGAKPLGEFICQLCKEEYSDPLTLAQHKCSRIVRVEYRCPECDKVFNCPANLASHRRWHKPRPGATSAAQVALVCEEPREGGTFEDASQFECLRCAKRFRRKSSLQKHLAVHLPLQYHGERSLSEFISPSSFSGDRANEFLEVREGGGGDPYLLGTGNKATVEQLVRQNVQVFPCKFCPLTFYSSPGLTRHINKCHPSENRQVILLQLPVRSTC